MSVPPEIRRLPCRIERLFDEADILPKFSYYNPSSAYPYIYVRATEKVEELKVEMNHMFLYSYKTDRMNMVHIPPGTLQPTLHYYQGIEDTRLFFYQKRLWFLSTSTHVTSAMKSEMLLGYFDEEVTRIVWSHPIDFGTRPIKNVCPFLDGDGDRLCAIDLYTLTIYQIVAQETPALSVVCRLQPCRGLRRGMLRGSTNPIHLHGGLWGCVAHEHIPKAGQGAHAYMSYWVEFDLLRGVVTFVSTPFFVSCLGIEFVSGMEYFREREEIELYLGERDREPLVAYSTLSDLRVGGLGASGASGP